MKINGKRAWQSSQAFTLIELMVVIAIIGILTAIIMANFLGAESKARDAKRVSDISQIQLALEGFFNRCGYYPGPVGGAVLSTSLTNASCPLGITLGSFISTIPTPPAGGGLQNGTSSYEYLWGFAYGDGAKNPINYVLGTTLENNPSSSGNITSFPSSGNTNGTVTYNSPASPSTFTFCDTSVHYCVGPQ